MNYPRGTLSKVSPNWTKQQLILPNHTLENYFGTVSDMSTQRSRTNQSEVDHPPIHSDTLLMLLPVAGTNKIQNHVGTCNVNIQYSWSCDLIPRPFLLPAVPTTNQNRKMECVILCISNSWEWYRVCAGIQFKYMNSCSQHIVGQYDLNMLCWQLWCFWEWLQVQYLLHKSPAVLHARHC